MVAQKGKDLLLKLASDEFGNLTTVAGMRSRRLAFNTETVDVTDFESAGRWRHLLSGAGVQRASVSGSGIFKDNASDTRIRELFFGSQIVDWQIVIPDFGSVSGPFQIASLEYAGEHNGEVSFDIALESAGQLTFEAIV
ncbi:MAG: phage major tail protein, TP901-1 family [Pseudomonadota bacterium]